MNNKATKKTTPAITRYTYLTVSRLPVPSPPAKKIFAADYWPYECTHPIKALRKI
jgi:hypothetical protein